MVAYGFSLCLLVWNRPGRNCMSSKFTVYMYVVMVLLEYFFFLILTPFLSVTFKSLSWGWRDSVAGRVLALHVADRASHLIPQSSPGVTSEHHWMWLLLQKNILPSKKKKKFILIMWGCKLLGEGKLIDLKVFAVESKPWLEVEMACFFGGIHCPWTEKCVNYQMTYFKN